MIGRRAAFLASFVVPLLPSCGMLGSTDGDSLITDLAGDWDSGCVELSTTSRRALLTFAEDGTFTEETSDYDGPGCTEGTERFRYRISASWAYGDLAGEFPVVARTLSEAAVTPVSSGTTAVLQFESCGGFSWVEDQEQPVGAEGLACLEQTNGSGDHELSIPALGVEQSASYSMADADTLELAWSASGSAAPSSLEGSVRFTRVTDNSAGGDTGGETGGGTTGDTTGDTSGTTDGGSGCATEDFDTFIAAHAGAFQSICLPKTAGGSNRYTFTLVDNGSCGSHALTWAVAGFSTTDCSGAQGGGQAGTETLLTWDGATDRASLQATVSIHFSFYDDWGTLMVDITHGPLAGSPVLGNALTPAL